MSEKIVLEDTEGSDKLEVYIIEETTINEKHYVLTSNLDPDSEEDSDENQEGEAYILREDECEGDPENFIFTTVTDDEELKNVAGIFKELLDDSEVTIE